MRCAGWVDIGIRSTRLGHLQQSPLEEGDGGMTSFVYRVGPRSFLLAGGSFKAEVTVR